MFQTNFERLVPPEEVCLGGRVKKDCIEISCGSTLFVWGNVPVDCSIEPAEKGSPNPMGGLPGPRIPKRLLLRTRTGGPEVPPTHPRGNEPKLLLGTIYLLEWPKRGGRRYRTQNHRNVVSELVALS